MEDRLVGVTEYCVHPKGAFGGLPRLGGTKDADVRAIIELAPDLVIANHEENTARVVRRLAQAGIDVWVTYPRTVREGARLLRDLSELGAAAAAVERWVVPVERAVEVAMLRADGSGQRPKVFCPIWRDPWMTIAGETYIHDMIELCGGENLVTALETPADRRYPIVDLDDVMRAQPDVILLPDEPYAFDEADRKRLSETDCPAARGARIHLIDGTLVSWYGPRIVEAIRVLARIFAKRV
jgi:ABC-type Fe3+-hydroxamate transport system substrate-binding protein